MQEEKEIKISLSPHKASKKLIRTESRRSNRNARKRRNRQRKTNRTRLTSGNTGFGTSAPAAVSSDLTKRVRFSSTRDGSGLRMKARVPLYQLCSQYYDISGTYRGAIARSEASGQRSVTGVSLFAKYGLSHNIVYCSYLSPVFDLMANNFVRYRVQGVRFCYEPQSTTVVEDRLVFAFAEDAIHPLIVTDTPSESHLLALSDSVAFAPWRSWEMDVSHVVRTNNLLYCYPTESSLVSRNIERRFSSFGSIGCIATVTPGTLQTEPKIYGILYAEFDFEFIEFCPIISDIPLQEESEHKGEEEVKSPESCTCNNLIKVKSPT